MTRLLEDMLTNQELQAIDQVLESNSSRFDQLVDMSGLDPATDFRFADLRWLNLCGADLRGFDFTGSDLRQCARNDNTVIDQTTIFNEAKIDWIELEALPIVTKMQEIESVSASEERQKLLAELTTEFGKTTHVITYMVSAASQSKTVEQFLDFAQFLPPQLPQSQSDRLSDAGLKLLRKKFAQSKSRTRRNTTAILALDDIVKKLQQTPGSLAESIYGHLAEIVTNKRQTVVLSRMAEVELSDMEDAFAAIGN